ncbi:T9SS type A sorting domain-containing protein [Niastella sp. OAS944]|uniref:T9SS type A sorting domain-containing protein n=1 Tax=Niastella sp. OAS944 TaxID=2664089 RepID=UPI00346FCD0C|nr:hypothetical protein [Chitinophagaceae bacterium OAS944]
MKLFCNPANIRWLLAINMVVFATRVATAQCPAGSTANATGTINNGQITCITTGVTSDITLNNGAKMVIISGGTYSGNISTNNGSTIEIQMGGQFSPNQANTFSAAVTNNGTVTINNISLSNGASFVNNGTFNWNSNWNQGSVTLAMTNSACGTMTFAQGTTVANNSTVDNYGVMNFTNSFGISSGSKVTNRGRVNVGGDLSLTGTFYNENIAVFRGNNNNISSSTVSDSLVNTGKIVITGAVTSSIRTRNDGLFKVNGSYTINGSTFNVNNSTAQLRVGGSFSNNGTLTGNGSLYVAGGIGNNGAIAGYGAGAQRLTVNAASVPGTQSNLIFNTSLAAVDTTLYNPPLDNPASCAVLPIRLSSLQAVYNNGRVQLNWQALMQFDVRSFTIEYSQDGSLFTEVGELAKTGANDAATPYVYAHTPAVTGTLYYRVRETTVDGAVYYSNMVTVKTGNMLLTNTEVFPNPFKDNLQISMQLEKAGMIQVALYDASGRLVKRSQQTGLVGRNTIAIGNLSALLPGVYLLQIKAGEHIAMQKLTK